MSVLFCSSGVCVIFVHIGICQLSNGGVGIFVLILRIHRILLLLLLRMMMMSVMMMIMITDSLTGDSNHLVYSTLWKFWLCRCQEALDPTQLDPGLSARKVVSYPLSHQALLCRATAKNRVFPPFRIYESLQCNLINARSLNTRITVMVNLP